MPRGYNSIFPHSTREQRMGNLIITFTALILLEGVLRKWLLPSLQQPLLLIREPLLLLIYVFYARDYGINRSWFVPYAFISIFLVALSLIQTVYWQHSLLITFIGIRSYILYIPLAFIIAEVTTARQMGRLLKMLLWASIPIGILVFLQFSLPVAHPINKGLSDDVEGRFTVAADIVRPYGPFTFSAVQAHFSALLLALLIICFEKRNKFLIPKWLLILSGFSIITMGALSGGRTYFGFAILIVGAYLVAGLTAPNFSAGSKRITFAIAITLIFSFTFISVFPRAFESMSYRQQIAVSHEGSTLDRVIRGLTNVVEPLDYAPLIGYGLGAGSNAARSAMGADDGFALGETEWIRMINEIGPLFGYLVLTLRITFVLWLGYVALVVNRRKGDGSALILYGFVGYLLFAGQVTLQSQLLSICWLCVGMTLTFARLTKDPS